MIIKKLKLHNFGVYAGDNEFDFTSDKPIVLIGGMNGRGKTTFLEAVLLSLYGSNSFAYTDSKKRTYSSYLKSFVSRSSKDKTSSVELEFEVNNGDIEKYNIKRTWDLSSKKIEENICASKNGMYNEFLTNNWAMFIESILPNALSNFFIFDGEQIVSLATDTTDEKLKTSIRAMLGISTLDTLKNDIKNNLKKIKSNNNNISNDKLKELRFVNEEALLKLNDSDIVLEACKAKLLEHQRILEHLKQEYTIKGGNALDKAEEINRKRTEASGLLNTVQNKLYEAVSGELPFLLVKDLIKDIKLQATDEHLDSIMKEAVSQVEYLYENFAASYKGNIQPSLDFMNYIKEYVNNDNIILEYNLSEQAIFQITNLAEKNLESSKENVLVLIGKKNNLEKQIDDLESYTKLDLNKKELSKLQRKIEIVESNIINDNIAVNEAMKKRKDANTLFHKTKTELEKAVEEFLESAEVEDNNGRIIKYSGIALNILEQYEIELQKNKIGVLAQTITDCYKKLANKTRLIDKVNMDVDTLDFHYILYNGEEISKDSLSAGEQQLIVISILWALSICSKKKLPVIIDTPLARLDSLHRNALITTYFPNAGEQTIILSTDSEINSKSYNLMKDNVGDEFTLVYSEKTHSTSVQRGYKVGAEQ